MTLFKDIYRLIKKYNLIVVARHIGADPDALGSQFAIKDLILNNFDKKQVYAVGAVASRFRFMGSLDKIDNLDKSQALLIVLDTPDKKRIDGANDIENYACVIKIDHHPFIEKYGNLEYIEECSSTCQLIIKFILENKLKLTDKIAENLYLGIVGDTDRFLHEYTSTETFELVTKLLKMSKINFTKLYSPLYSRPFVEVRFEGYIYENISITENGFAYIKLTKDILKKYNVDSASAGNMVNNLKYVSEIIIWAFFSEDEKMGIIKANIRSCGPAINDIVSKHGGGGHKFASGARLNNWNDVDNLIKDLDDSAKEFKLH